MLNVLNCAMLFRTMIAPTAASTTVRIWTITLLVFGCFFSESSHSSTMTCEGLFGADLDRRPQLEPVFRQDQYDQTRILPLALLQSYPPRSHIYVFVGSSLIPEYAFFKTYMKDHPEVAAINLPFSSAQGVPTHVEFTERRIRLDEHISRFLKPDALKSGRTIVVIDYTISGISLFQAGLAVAYHLKNVGLENKIIMMAFQPLFVDTLVQRGRAIFSPLVPPMLIFENSEVHSRGGHFPVQWREYGHFNLGRKFELEGPFPNFSVLMNYMSYYLKRDPQFDEQVGAKTTKQISIQTIGSPVTPSLIVEVRQNRP